VCRLKYKKTETPKGVFTRVSNNKFNKYLKNGTWNYLKPAQVAAIKRARAREKTKPKAPVINKDLFDDILAFSNNKQNALQQVKNLENAGYVTNLTALHNFHTNLNTKYAAKRPNTENAFLTAKEMMSMAPTKSKRAIIYSSLYKTLPMHERKVLAYFRDHGVWHARNYFKKTSPSVKPPIKRKSLPKTIPINSPATERRKEVLAQFKPFWNGTTSNNHNTIRNYIAAHKSPIRKATNANKYKSALENINALKTAKARAEWLKAKKLNFTKGNLQGLKNYVKGKNQANRNRRAAKKA